MRELLNEQQRQVEAVKSQADSYIESTLNSLKAEGVIKSSEDEDALIRYAIDKKEPDLLKAADRWLEIKQAREEGKKEVAKVKVRQEEGSKVGTSSKVSGSEQGGVSIESLQKFKRDFNW
jgi:molecular chaperone DnaK (HSP70)